jgi:hypothetical protein
MKSIKLKVSKEFIQGRDTFLTTYDLLKSAINNPTQNGFTVEEMMQRLRLLDKVDAHKSIFEIKAEDYNESILQRTATLELEDSDFNKLNELFKEMKWGIVSKTIIELSEEFNK